MDATFWLEKLLENIQYQLRHSNYERSVEIRDFSYQMSTGLDQSKELTRYRRFEADDLKKQRERLTNTLTKYALSRPRKYLKWVERIDGMRLSVEAADTQKLAELQGFFQSFLPGQTMDEWVMRAADRYGMTDPNAWAVCERQNIVEAGQTVSVRPYAFIFPSVDALNFEHDVFGNVAWFIGRTSTIEHIVSSGVRRERVLENYYLYAPGFAARARERGEKTQIEDGEFETTLQIFPPIGGLPVQRQFFVKIVENGTVETPAMPLGCYVDEATNSNTTFVPWFYPAEHLLKDLIRYKSTEDVVLTTHAYPKRWEFERECTFHDERGQCEGGYMGGGNDVSDMCPVCKGTGFPANFTTEQASVKLILPSDSDSQDKLLDLSKLSFVEQVQIELLTHMGTKVEETERKIMAAIFDTGLYQKPTDSKTRTATEVRGELDGISDVLRPYTKLISRGIEFFYRIGAQYLEFELKVSHSYPEDLSIATLANEVAVLNEMNDSGVGFEAISAQKGRVLEKVFEGQPMERERAAAKRKHEPFAGHSIESVAMIVAGRDQSDPDRVLWENFENIFLEIFDEDEKFHLRTFADQKARVAEKVEVFKNRVVSLGAMEQVDAPNFNDVA